MPTADQTTALPPKDGPRVVVATDGSDTALHAAHTAVRLVRPDAEVIVATVVPAREDPMETAGGIAGPAITDEQADQEARDHVAEGRSAVADAAAEVPGGPRTIVLPSRERPDEALQGLVEELDADLLVVGTDQPGLLERLLGGSTAGRLVQRVRCPVLVVPHPD